MECNKEFEGEPSYSLSANAMSSVLMGISFLKLN